MRRFLLAAAMFGAAASCADAADMPDFLRGSFSSPPAPRTNWQGYYVGGQGSFGTSDMNFTGSTRTVAAALLANTAIEAAGQVSSWPVGGGKVSAHGHGWGAFAGYNGQWDDVVLGVEANYVHGKFGGSATGTMGRSFVNSLGYTNDVTYDSTSSMAISDMGTLRIRGGYAVDFSRLICSGALRSGKPTSPRRPTSTGLRSTRPQLPASRISHSI